MIVQQTNQSSVGNAEKTQLDVLTVDASETMAARVRQDPAFARALLSESISLFANGESDVCRLMLRDLVNATIGFERLAIEVSKPSKSLHRMLSVRGNPTMDNLVSIISVLRQELKVTTIEVAALPE